MIIFVGAHGQNLAMGKDGHLPWEGSLMQHDKERLHQLARGKTIVMGEKTYLGYKDIEDAFQTTKVIVVSRSTQRLPGAQIVDDIQKIIELGKSTELWVIGGGSMFAQLLPYADKMFLTRIEAEFEADVFFPEYDLSEWQIVHEQACPADADNPYPYTFLDLVRKHNIQ